MSYIENALWPESDLILPVPLGGTFCCFRDEEIETYSSEAVCQRIHV